tara:strand:+ start:112 stop:1011 length:900 start_codon:yes stop_codon:yes gene_type:complete
MSFRPSAEKKAPAQDAAKAAPAPGLDRLSHVLSVGIGNTPAFTRPVAPVGAVADVDPILSKAEFEAEFMRLVEIDAMKMKKLTMKDYDRYKKEAKAMLSDATKEAAKGLSKASAEAGRLAAGTATLTKKGAAILAEEFKRRWQGASKPLHWTTSKPTELATVLKENYRKTFPERAWKNILAGNNADRWYYSESGGNCHAKIEIDDIDDDKPVSYGLLTVTVFISMIDDPKDDKEKALAASAEKLEGVSTLELGNSFQMKSITHKQIMERIDVCIMDAVFKMTAEWDAAILASSKTQSDN